MDTHTQAKHTHTHTQSRSLCRYNIGIPSSILCFSSFCRRFSSIWRRNSSWYFSCLACLRACASLWLCTDSSPTCESGCCCDGGTCALARCSLTAVGNQVANWRTAYPCNPPTSNSTHVFHSLQINTLSGFERYIWYFSFWTWSLQKCKAQSAQ